MWPINIKKAMADCPVIKTTGNKKKKRRPRVLPFSLGEKGEGKKEERDASVGHKKLDERKMPQKFRSPCPL